MLNDFEKDSKALKTTLLRMCWYMRGGLSLEEAWTIGSSDRDIINDIIKENLKTTEETKMPFF
jgi:hypothetical protein